MAKRANTLLSLLVLLFASAAPLQDFFRQTDGRRLPTDLFDEPTGPSNRRSTHRVVDDSSSGQVRQTDDEQSRQRREMVKEQIADRGIKDSATLRAMEAVPRHEFVPESYRKHAYDDGPLPIGYGQTISQPYIVALMTELANLSKGKKALEIGTGSGYQAAVLAQIIDSVYTMEIVKELGESARERLTRLGYQKVKTKIGDGYFGWEEHAPFDAIIVTAAAEHIPPPLVKQLKDGGRMVIPVGHPYFTQNLVLVEKKGGKVTSRDIIPVRFVPLTGGPPR